MRINNPANLQQEIHLLNGVAKLTHLGVIKIEGEDAVKFIHSQVTQDFSLLGLDAARLAAFCSIKGRIQASFIGFKRDTNLVLLICSQDILESTIKRLSSFVMRAKARLSNASEEYALYGLAGNATKDMATPADAMWSKLDIGEASLIRLYPASGVFRQMWVAPATGPRPQGTEMALAVWLWGEVLSAVTTITAQVVEAFIPQMLNYESIGGVSFKKGCYPGQEVVARSQFRGTLKRRALLVHCQNPMKPGDEIFDAEGNIQSVGMVVQAAKAPNGEFDAIACVQVSSVEAGALHLSDEAASPLALLPLPYALKENL